MCAVKQEKKEKCQKKFRIKEFGRTYQQDLRETIQHRNKTEHTQPRNEVRSSMFLVQRSKVGARRRLSCSQN